MNTNKSPLFAFDPRWHKVGAVMDAIAIIKDFEEKIKSINSHALHPDLLNIAVNLGEIHREATGMKFDLAKMQAHLNRLLGATEQELYEQPSEDESMRNGNGKQKVKLPRRKAKPRQAKRKYRGFQKKIQG